MDFKPNKEILTTLNKITDRHFGKACGILKQNKTEVTQVVIDAIGKELHFLKQDLYTEITGRNFLEDFGNEKSRLH
ncbi:MAG TPA: hypothetical protein VMW66_03860 [Elusimicrobiales bacterium]|nr:hypothetical protein [Elusimicrobiales bacterium]